jgi:hypothetical protein
MMGGSKTGTHTGVSKGEQLPVQLWSCDNSPALKLKSNQKSKKSYYYEY